MYRFSFVFSIFLAALAHMNLQAVDKQKMIEDLTGIKNVFEAKYAPVEWKKEHSGWQLDQEIAEAKVKIESSDALSVKGYHEILHRFFRGTRDWHVQDFYYSKEASFLPFRINPVGDKFLIGTMFDEENLNFLRDEGYYMSEDTLDAGDEVVSYNGKPIKEVVEEILANEFAGEKSKTALSLAALRLTQSLAFLGEKVFQGMVEIEYRHAGEKDIKRAFARPLYLPESVMDKPAAKTLTFGRNKSKASWQTQNMTSPLYHTHKTHSPMLIDKAFKQSFPSYVRSSSQAGHSLQAFDSFAELGTPIRSEMSLFPNYIYLSPTTQKRVGVIRLSSYMPILIDENWSLVYAPDIMLEKLADILALFQKETDVLVIDQRDNGGGDFLYMCGILSMLTEESLKLPLQRMMITQEDVFSALEDLEDFDDIENQEELTDLFMDYGSLVDLEFAEGVKHYLNFIVKQWEEGKTLSDRFYLLGLEAVRPHQKVRYTKPIVVLIDHQDFSAADFFPAILQDNKRAVLFGEKTAGAGGVVCEHSYPNALGVMGFSYTTTFAERVNGQPIENLGVTPDISYETTVEDVRNGYKGYVEAVNKVVEKQTL